MAPLRKKESGGLYVQNIDEKVIRRFKAKCASEGEFMKDVLQRLMADYTKHRNKEVVTNENV